MARSCRFSLGSRAGAAEWTYDGTQLTLSPGDGGPITVALEEIAGIGGDGYTVQLAVPGISATSGATPGAAPAEAAGALTLTLERLGADGPTLLEELRREWLTARAGVLRLAGSGEGKRFYGRVDGLGGVAGAAGGATGSGAAGGTTGGAAEPFQALLFEDVLAVARDGRDLAPLFLALCDSVQFDDAGYLTRIKPWPAGEVAFSKMAGQTDEFLGAVRKNRELLAGESAALLGAAAPALPAAGRASLAGVWLPGRLLEIEAMDSLCPGFAAAFAERWLPGLVRSEEGRCLLERGKASGAGGRRSTWLGFTRGAGEAGGAGDENAPADAGGADAAQAAAAAAGADVVPAAAGATADAGEGLQPLWLLAGSGDTWFLEALSIEDRATYCFKGGAEIPVLVSQLLCAPQFSKEALYSRLEELTGQSARLAIPARSLGFLVELRARFTGRVIHQSAEGWRKDVERLAAG